MKHIFILFFSIILFSSCKHEHSHDTIMMDTIMMDTIMMDIIMKDIIMMDTIMRIMIILQKVQITI